MDELLHFALEGHRQRAFALVREERIVQAHRVEEFIFADLQLVQLRSFLQYSLLFVVWRISGFSFGTVNIAGSNLSNCTVQFIFASSYNAASEENQLCGSFYRCKVS